MEEVVSEGCSAVHGHGYGGVHKRGIKRPIQSSNLKRSKLLCFHRLLQPSCHSCPPPSAFLVSKSQNGASFFQPLSPPQSFPPRTDRVLICINYSSPTLDSAMSNLTPAFTFILAVFFRMESLALRSYSTQAKIMGTLVSISGALVVVLYKGPTILSTPSDPNPSPMLSTPPTNWVIGGLLCALQYLLYSTWYILQTHVMKAYPAEIVLVFLYNLCGTIISAPVCFIAETNLSAWRLRPDIALVAIIYSGCLGSSFGSLVHTWALHLKGPVYISIFKPLSIAIAAALSVIFLGDALSLGSIVGAIILSMGFYAVIWGKSKEEQMKPLPIGMGKVPLLESYKVENM
ncbi:WAT1-related protein At5g40230 isoform X2 [Pyrus x bretschneideri]|uniref:WAT1-related protein At5g40230 isoform X2 n=1 Tax=Pyrus x bretschneideri TaxID=225117 RepID=UPI00202F1EF8|nr:WAT1-related protein At5g40230 isoform X2 [Pyrus x bretschneideri]